MPIYEYVCTTCDHRADILHGINDPGPNFCPSCGEEGTMRKQFAPPAIHYKGSGWAKKDRGGSSSGTKSSRSGGGSGKDDKDGGDSRSDAGSTASADTAKPANGLRIAMPSAADWITLSEAADILAAANVHSGRRRSAPGRDRGGCPASSSGVGATSGAGEVKALVIAPRRVPADAIQPGLFEDVGD